MCVSSRAPNPPCANNSGTTTLGGNTSRLVTYNVIAADVSSCASNESFLRLTNVTRSCRAMKFNTDGRPMSRYKFNARSRWPSFK